MTDCPPIRPLDGPTDNFRIWSFYEVQQLPIWEIGYVERYLQKEKKRKEAL